MNMASLRVYRERLDKERDLYFHDWPVSNELRNACWLNLATTLDALIELGDGGTKASCLDLLRQCIERYNDLDDGSFGTIEREDLCDMLYQIGSYCDLDTEGDWVDEWRDW